MGTYLDTNVLVSLVVVDALSPRAEVALRQARHPLYVSDFTRTEFAAVMARRSRTGASTPDEAQEALVLFDDWVVHSAKVIQLLPSDLGQATRWLRGLQVPLQAPDAIHLAVAARWRAALLTFDRQLATAARALNVPLAEA